MDSEPCLQNGPRITVSKRSARKQSIRMEGPDGGWAWCVAFAACLINFIMAGLGRMSGILYVAFIELYHVDRRGASMPFTVRSSTRNLLGPVVGILGQKYGVRAIAITGGMIATVSAASCFYANDIVWITILWGGINGAGTALTTTLCQVVIGQYFRKYRTTAAGMSFSGGCIGAFLFPVLMEWLLHTYGIQGTFLIIGGIIMHCIPAAMLLRKPPWMKNSRAKNIEKITEEEELINSSAEDAQDGAVDNCNKNSNENIDIQYLLVNEEVVLSLLNIEVSEKTLFAEVNQNDIRPSEKDILKEMNAVYSYIEKMDGSPVTGTGSKARMEIMPTIIQMMFQEGKSVGRSHSFNLEKFHFKNNFHNIPVPGMQSVPDITKFSEEITRKYIIKKLRRLNEVNDNWIASHFPESERSDALRTLHELQKIFRLCSETKMDEDEPNELVVFVSYAGVMETVPYTPEGNSSNTHSNSFLDHIKTALKLYTKPIFLLICLCRAAHFISFVPVVTTVVDFSMDKGLDGEEGKYVIACLSAGDLLGRLCLGWITDRGYVSLPRYMLFVMVIHAAVTSSLPLMYAKAAFLCNLALYGMLQGSVFIRHPVLISKYMETNEQSIAMGCINFFSGLLGFALPSYIGYFRDTVGSYDFIYYINGLISASVGLLWILEPYLSKCSECKVSKNDNAPEAV